MGKMEERCDKTAENVPPVPPPLPGRATNSHRGRRLTGQTSVPSSRTDMWDRMFDEGYRADVVIDTDNGGSISAHANVLGMASPVMKGMLKQANFKGQGRQKSISIRGVPHDAVRIFIRFLYSFCYEREELEEFVMHLLVLSHVFVVPELKRICVQQLEQGFLTAENVVDTLQLALLCDAPRLSFICHRIIVRNFEEVLTSGGWEAMKASHPVLEKQLLDSIANAENREKERIRKGKERKIYMELYEAMEALVHICREGCWRIGPCDKDLKGEKEKERACKYSAYCKGIEELVRHVAACKLRKPAGCIHCKRMWQLLELHSRLCINSDSCRVPLCRNFKIRMRKQNKKDEIKWQILVKKILTTKAIGRSPFFISAISS